MQNKTSQEAYRSLIDFIGVDSQRDRHLVNRRMLSVFFWCFILPAMTTAAMLLLMKLGFLPRRARSSLDLVILIFPVLYSIYFLSSQVLIEVPAAFRRGGIATTLGENIKESTWRENVCEGMRRDLVLSSEQWSWVITSFKMDLKRLQNRTRHLTALAGAVFFLIMQGIDLLGGEDKKVTWVIDAVFGWVEASGNDTTQFLALGLFLVLLYLSGTQTYHSLERYLSCAELLKLEKDQTATRPSS